MAVVPAGPTWKYSWSKTVNSALVQLSRALLAMDLTHVNQALALKGASAIEAILGGDVFEAQAVVINYSSQ